MAGNAAQPGRTVTSKVVAILQTFTDAGARNLTEIARLSDLPVSTVHRLTAELAAGGMLERTDDGKYRPGLQLRLIGSRASGERRAQERAHRVMEDLAVATRASVRLGVLDDLEVAYIEKRPAGRAPDQVTGTATAPAHASAMGKALLAFGSPRLVERVIERGLRRYTAYTVTDPDLLRRSLATTRRTRVAVTRRELDPATSSVAVPVFGPGGTVVAALELAVQDPRVDLRAAQPALAVAARGLSRELASPSSAPRRDLRWPA